MRVEETTQNEAAERLRDKMIEHAPSPLVAQYEQAVRRATVERIRAAVTAVEPVSSFVGITALTLILDEEAAR